MTTRRRLHYVFGTLAVLHGLGLSLLAFGLSPLWIAAGWGALVATSLGVALRHLDFHVAAPLAAVAAHAGQSTSDVPHHERDDEIGQISRAIAAANFATAQNLSTADATAPTDGVEDEPTQSLDAEVEKFIGDVSAAMARLRTQTQSLENTSASLSSSATSAQSSASAARDASTTASDNANAVSAATQQLNASISRITEQANTARSFVEDLSQSAHTSNREIGALAEAAEQIGSIISLIQGVAQQTNLLALNATIEAARAGEAGRGFAVVASEVKALSGQTAKATDQIYSQIAQIQQKTAVAVDAIRGITSKLGAMNELTLSIASAVQQQESATGEIARSIQHAADGSSQASQAADRVSDAAAETSSEADMLAITSRDVSAVGDDIEKAVKSFIAIVRGDMSERRGSARSACAVEGTIVSGDRSFPVRAIECAPDGFKIAQSVPAPVGSQVRFRGPGFDVAARVAWTNATGAGFVLLTRGFDWRRFAAAA